MEDSNCKGVIGKNMTEICLNSEEFCYFSLFLNLLELSEVQSVTPAMPAQVGTKKIDEKAFFDVSVILHFCQYLTHYRLRLTPRESFLSRPKT